MELVQSRYKIACFTLAWAILWCLVYLVSDKVLKPQGISYLHNPTLFSIYFLSLATFYTFLFKTNQEVALLLMKNRWPLLIICFSFVFITWGIGYFFPVSQDKINEFIKSGFLYPHMTFATAISKGADVLFQQTLILTFLIRMEKIILDKKKILYFFGLSFFVLHVPLVVTMGKVAFLFIIPSTIAGFIFSYFILNYTKGIVYSLGTHLFFYVLLGIILRYFV